MMNDAADPQKKWTASSILHTIGIIFTHHLIITFAMNKVNAIVQNPGVEEQIIFYVGMRHMQYNWRQHIDPKLPYEPDELSLYYKEMKIGMYGDLRISLREEFGLSHKDPEFRPTLDAAIGLIIARHGMESILKAAKEFLHVLQAPITDAEREREKYDPLAIFCPVCNRGAVHLGYEDLPSDLIAGGKYEMGDNFGLCRKCNHIFEAR